MTDNLKERARKLLAAENPACGFAWCVSETAALRAIEKALSLPTVSGAECRHEPYQGACVHCGIPFRFGQPFYGDQPVSVEARNAVIEECANIAEAIDSGRGNEAEIAKAIRGIKTLSTPPSASTPEGERP